MWDDVVNVSRSELVRVFVLNELADDYEEFDHISENVIKLGVDCGLTIHSSEILDALMYLIESGLAKAYRLGGPTAEEIQGVPPRDEIEHWWDGARHIGCYSFITKKGSAVLSSSAEYWPFDDKNQLRENWSPPAS